MTPLPDTMSSFAVTYEGGAISRQDVPVPRPAVGEVLVEVHAFAVNRGELALVAHRSPGWQPGQDVAGRVVALGEDVTGVEVGERVAALADGGGWSQYVAVPACRVAAVPDSVDVERAAALPMAGTTALGLVLAGGAVLGQRVLVTGASGGVGGFAVQLLARSGAQVVAVAGAAHEARLRTYGAAEVVADVAAVDGRVSFAVDGVGGRVLSDVIATLAPEGTVVVFGNSSGEPTLIELGDFIAGNDEASLRTYVSYRHEAMAGARLTTLLGLVARGELQVEIGRRGSCDDTAAVLDDLRDRRFGGKAVLTVGTA